MNHFIPLDQAKQMTGLYRQNRESILKPELQGQDLLSICETFDAASFRTVLEQQGCESLRIYYGMSDDKKVHAIIVGVNANNEDILPTVASGSGNTTTEESGILEVGIQCPPACPPESPLNT